MEFLTNSVDPHQTAPVGTAWSGSTLFAYLLRLADEQTFV